jgi:hypothetical protein
MPIVLALALAIAAPGQRHDVGAEVYARVADSVLLVIVENSKGEAVARGSAFVVAGGRLVTNAHVIKDGRLFVRSGAFKIACTVERIDEALDLALLKPSAEISARPLALASRLPPSGSKVFALGNPQGLERTITEGLLTGTRTVRAMQMLQLSAAISPGSSGGPIVLATGEVIGVATLSMSEGQALNFAVPATAVTALISNQSPTAQGSAQPKPSKLIPAVVAALEVSKLQYQKSGEGVWWISYKGDNLASVDVAVQAQEEMVVITSLVRKKASLSAEALEALLRANYDANLSKVALDAENDLMALTELPPDFTATSLKNAVVQVARLADDAAGLLSSRGSATVTVPAVPPGRGATLSLLRGAFELSYDPAKWKLKPTTEPTEIELQHVSGDAGVKVISERLEIPQQSLKGIVVENAKELAPDVTVVNETSRVVNGLDVVLLRYAGTASGIKFTFYNQMHSDTSGTIQLAAFTGTNLFDEYQRDFLELFAGLKKLR